MSEITPGERRELRSVVKGQYKVLRAEVKRREQELKAEIEQEILDRYREQDAAIGDAKREVQQAIEDCVRQMREIGERLQAVHPNLVVETGTKYGRLEFAAHDPNRAQLHRAAMASIPNTIGDAQLALDRQEMDLLRKLSETALSSEAATEFLGSIPTVGELVPSARLRELEASLREAGDP